MENKKDITKEYTNGEVTVVWKPNTCIHSAICANGLPQVFNPKNKPWVNKDGASTQEIKDQIDKCPSGALSYYMNDDSKTGKVKTEVETIVEISPNGPLLAYGNVTVKYPDGKTEQKNKVTAFCRCGHSNNKPFCDGSHRKENFVG